MAKEKKKIDDKKRRSIALIILIILVIIIIFLIYKNFLMKPKVVEKIEVIEKEVPRVIKVKFEEDLFETPLYLNLQKHGDFPVSVEFKGKLNPFETF